MRFLVISGCFLVLSCSPKSSSAGAGSANERERDSVLGESRLPGAQGIRGALRVSDSASTRQARLDSVDDQP
jgi:hypothetical protein